VPRPLEFVVTRSISAPNDVVWRVLGDFGAEHRWTRSVSQCARDTAEVGVGTVRSCRLPRPLMGRTQVREVLTEFEYGRSLAYSLEGAAGPFAFASSRWSTSVAADRVTAVTVQGSFEPKNAAVRLMVWPFAKPMLQRVTKRVLQELEAFLMAAGSPASRQSSL
jgi:uncharacterized protein YndB with AHSA1/START domain